MSRFIFVLVLMFGVATGAVAQNTTSQSVSWQALQQVSFREVFMEMYGMYYDMPTFSAQVKELEGKQITVTGYVIPVDISADYYVLSAFPFNNCFFCGNAGPESVMDLQLASNSSRYKTDDRRTFTGILELNSSNVFQMIYILKNAREVND